MIDLQCKLKVNSYRGFILKILFFGIITLTIPIILMALGTIWEISRHYWITLLILSLFEILLIVFFVMIKFCKGINYTFAKNEICVFDKDKLQETIVLQELESISYCAFRYRNIFFLLLGYPLQGAWKLYVKFNNGDVKEIPFISITDAKKLKLIYGEKLNIK